MTRLLKGRYEILEVVARGGEGEVVHALDHLHEREVALKLREADSAAKRATLTAEARVLFGVRPHPGVTLLREDFFTGKRYCMVMDWIAGRSLARVVAEDGEPGLELGRALRYLAEAAEALDHLHSHDPPIIHRDVKPANLIESSSGRIVLVDFGIATETRPSGTIGFAAPEVLAGGRADPRSDVYSLAITACVLLTGAPPVFGSPPSWHGLGRTDARRVQRVLARALALDPARRPSSAPDLVRALTPKPRAAPKPGPHNLPASTTSFVGRRREMAQVLRLLRTSRLVTLVGTGGVGKTRLALQAASAVVDKTPGGVWMVDLASLSGGVTEALASVLGLREEPGRTLAETISSAIGVKDVLLVLDNCEHVVDPSAALVAELLRSCPKLSVLATSRRPLAVAGEVALRVPSLDVPGVEVGGKRLGSSDSVRLFADRATAANPQFRLGDGGDVVEICRSLDGVPLAIELAAARSAVLSPREILEHLGDRLRLLAGRDAPERHRTLQAALDWGHDLLATEERTLLRRLSVFRGGWTLDAAEDVCSFDPLAREEILGSLSGLVDMSFVGAETAGGRTRYTVLQTVLAYAEERLEESGEAPAARSRHQGWARGLAERAEPELVGAEQGRWLAVLDAERDNLRAAASGRGEDAARTAAALGRYWLARGAFSEGRRILTPALSAPLPAAVESKALNAAGGLALAQADHAAARGLFERSLLLRREIGDRAGTAAALNNLGILARESGDLPSARAFMEESLAIQREEGDERGVSAALHNLALIALAQDDYPSARSLGTESLESQRRAGDRHGAAGTLINLGIVAWTQGDCDAARQMLEESLSVNRELGDEPSAAACLHNLGLVARDQCRADDARDFFEQALAVHRRIGDERAAARSIAGLGMACVDVGDLGGARAYLKEALDLQEKLSDVEGRGESLACLGIVAVLAEEFDAARDLIAGSLRLRSTPRGVAECLEWLARAEPDPERSAVLLGAADDLRQSIGAPVSALDAPALEKVLDETRDALGMQFDRAYARGRSLSADRAIAFATSP